MEDLEELKALGVGAMVTLNEAWEMQLSNRFVRDDCGLEHLHLPTPDFFAPTQEDIQAAVQFITAFVSRGIGVYVHCNGGKGRSAVCVICFLASFKEWSPEVAFDHVKSQRRIASMRGSFGLHKQWRAVKRFCRQFVRKGRREAFKDPSNAVASNAPVPRNDLEDGKEDANCSEVTAKPSELAKIAPALAPELPPASPKPEKLPETEGDVAMPETHVAIAALNAPEALPTLVHTRTEETHVAIAPLNAPQPLPTLVHTGTEAPEYQEHSEAESSDSEEEPPLLE